MAQTLLLADDSVTIQRVIELTFADQDIQVVAVSDGNEAIAALQEAPPDIVLADVGMPGRSGYEVAEYIRDTPQLAHIPVVLLTGAFEPVDQHRADSAGCDAVLAKPFEPQAVIGRVKELLDRPRQDAEDVEREQHAAQKVAPFPVPERARAVGAALPAPARETAQALADDYFDRLDQALADGTFVLPPEAPESQPAPVLEAKDRFQAGPPPMPASEVGPPASASQPSSAPVTVPALADAFAALLEAEQASPESEPALSWPASSAPPVVGDEVVDEVARRVLERLSDRVVRTTVAEVVSSVAERLVREEIDRIKSAIR